MSPRERILEKARALGFDAVGIARADEPLDVEFERYEQFVAAEKHGAMHYVAEHREARRRLDGESILTGAKTVICLARRYARPAEHEALDPPLARLMARYARGQDYHNHLRKKLRALARFCRSLEPGARARPLCDEEPVLERAWAARAGLGFIGKHGLVIVPGKGSFILLGEVVTTLDLPADIPMTERCGSCTRCLDACPTKAFDAPFVLDPRRCIAYLTIEDPSPPPQDLEPAMGEHLFGCDECQTVCPFNRTAPPPIDRTRPFHPLPTWEKTRTLHDLVVLDDPAYFALTIGTPVRRATRAGLARSAVLVAASRARHARKTGAAVADDAIDTLRTAAHHDVPAVRALAQRHLAELRIEPEQGSRR